MFYKGKKVLVTGGTGFIGTNLVEALLAAGAQVRITTHRRPPAVARADVETVAADLERPADCLRALQGAQYVFHAAGAVSAAGVTASNPLNAITANLVLTARVLEAATLAGTERILIFGSSTGYPAADHPIREEEMWTGPTYPAYFGYGWMRRYLERLSEFVASKSKVKVALARPTAVYGRYDDFDDRTSHVIPALIKRALSDEDPFLVWGTGEEVRDFLEARDLARGCLLLLEKHAECDPVNLGSGQGIAVKELVTRILKASGRGGADLKFDPTKPTTIPFRVADVSKAQRLLGFAPAIGWDQGLTETIAWYRATRGEKAAPR